MSIKRGTIVQVDWLDASAQGEWVALKDVDLGPSLVHSVGFVIHDTAAGIALVGDCNLTKLNDPEETVNRAIIIPRGMVQKVRRL